MRAAEERRRIERATRGGEERGRRNERGDETCGKSLPYTLQSASEPRSWLLTPSPDFSCENSGMTCSFGLKRTSAQSPNSLPTRRKEAVSGEKGEGRKNEREGRQQWKDETKNRPERTRK